VVLLVFVRPNPILILIAIVGTMDVWRRWNTRKQGLEGNAEYYRVKGRHRLAVGAVYVGLIVALAIGMDVTHVVRDFGSV
jgi:hypothetical protein